MPGENPKQEGETPKEAVEVAAQQTETEAAVSEETTTAAAEVQVDNTETESPPNPSEGEAATSENGVKPSEEAPVVSAPSEEAGVATVSDPTLVDIDKLIEGKEIFSPAVDDENDMADTKHGKRDKKKRSKDPAIDAIMVAMRSLPPDEQVATVLSKYAELADNNRQLNSTLKGIQKQVENIQREKETMETEHSKIVLTKARLESLCRELQKQNKLIKDENVTRLKEEEERRKEVSAKFNTTLSEISNLMKENSEKNNKLRDENHDMAGRLQDLVKQYEAREQHVEKILKAKDLQCQLVEAKLAKQHIEVTENKEKMLLEKKALLEDIGSYQVKLQTMSENEISLRTQLNSYMEKYEEFQTTLDRSNKIFNTFKKEMDEMTKKIKKLEKETKTWKERWEGANKALLDMVTERSELEKKLDTQARQNAQLKNLCRALQEQVTELRNQNKSSQATEAKVEALSEVLAVEEAAVAAAAAIAKEVTNGEGKAAAEVNTEVTANGSSTEEEIPDLISEEEKEVTEPVVESLAATSNVSEESPADPPVPKTETVHITDYLGVD